jgi:hypothetical protein
MAKFGENLEVQTRTLSDEDIAHGGYVPTPDDPASRKGLNKMRSAGGVRDKLTQAQIKARIAALWRRGHMYKDLVTTINDEFGLTGTENEITYHTIKYHVNEMLEYWREKSLAHIDERQAMTLLRYDQIEQLATEAWFTSMGGKKTRNYERQITRASSDGRQKDIADQVISERASMEKAKPLFSEGELLETLAITAEKIKTYTRTEESPGDPRFLAIMIDINHKRSQLWGLLNKGEQTTSDQEMARLSDDARTERIAAVIAQARQRASGDMGHLVQPSPLGGFKEGEEPTEEQRGAPPEKPVFDAPAVAQQEVINIDDFEWE